MVIHSNPLKKYIWKNRVIVTFSPNKNNTDRSHFLNSINKNLCEYNSRNIIHIDLLFNENNKEIEKFKSFFEKLSISPSEFRLILFGKEWRNKIKLKKNFVRRNIFFDRYDANATRRNVKRQMLRFDTTSDNENTRWKN